MAVEHDHILIDADPHFSIDPITRAITNAESKKVSLMQYDNNSERFSFDIDRKIEGHDMLNCDRVQIHYYNVSSSSRARIPGLYKVTDLQVSTDNDKKLTFSWLISSNVTKQAGQLSFLISFECTRNGDVIYRWNTGVNNSIVVTAGMNNDEFVPEEYPDVLLQWESEMSDHIFECEQQLINNFNTNKIQIEDEIDSFKYEMKTYIDGKIIEPTTFATSSEVSAIFEGTTVVEDDTLVIVNDEDAEVENGTLIFTESNS